MTGRPLAPSLRWCWCRWCVSNTSQTVSRCWGFSCPLTTIWSSINSTTHHRRCRGAEDSAVHWRPSDPASTLQHITDGVMVLRIQLSTDDHLLQHQLYNTSQMVSRCWGFSGPLTTIWSSINSTTHHRRCCGAEDSAVHWWPSAPASTLQHITDDVAVLGFSGPLMTICSSINSTTHHRRCCGARIQLSTDDHLIQHQLYNTSQMVSWCWGFSCPLMTIWSSINSTFTSSTPLHSLLNLNIHQNLEKKTCIIFKVEYAFLASQKPIWPKLSRKRYVVAFPQHLGFITVQWFNTSAYNQRQKCCL